MTIMPHDGATMTGQVVGGLALNRKISISKPSAWGLRYKRDQVHEPEQQQYRDAENDHPAHVAKHVRDHHIVEFPPDSPKVPASSRLAIRRGLCPLHQ
jgi:hypothetical protein